MYRRDIFRFSKKHIKHFKFVLYVYLFVSCNKISLQNKHIVNPLSKNNKQNLIFNNSNIKNNSYGSFRLLIKIISLGNLIYFGNSETLLIENDNNISSNNINSSNYNITPAPIEELALLQNTTQNSTSTIKYNITNKSLSKVDKLLRYLSNNSLNQNNILYKPELYPWEKLNHNRRLMANLSNSSNITTLNPTSMPTPNPFTPIIFTPFPTPSPTEQILPPEEAIAEAVCFDNESCYIPVIILLIIGGMCLEECICKCCSTYIRLRAKYGRDEDLNTSSEEEESEHGETLPEENNQEEFVYENEINTLPFEE